MGQEKQRRPSQRDPATVSDAGERGAPQITAADTAAAAAPAAASLAAAIRKAAAKVVAACRRAPPPSYYTSSRGHAAIAYGNLSHAELMRSC